MRYALLTGFSGMPFPNFGDGAQSMAIEYLYRHMNIPEKEIYHITFEELPSYDGEPLLLPWNYFLSFLAGNKGGNIQLSDKITPVFLGATLTDSKLSNRYSADEVIPVWKDFLLKYAPIGCRDEYTRKLLSEYNIPAYLQGCITNVIPKREEGNYTKVLLVNCPVEVLHYIPKKLLDNAEVMFSSGYTENKSADEIWLKIKELYQYIRDNAMLVVSSRYHVVTPCNAMGIPSIFVRKTSDVNFTDVRLETLNPHIPIYTSENFPQIDWSPRCEDFSDMKRRIRDLAIARIQEAHELADTKELIREFYKPSFERYSKNIKNMQNLLEIRLREFIEARYAAPKKGKFFIWGAKYGLYYNGKVSLVEFVSKLNPNLEFTGWIDTYKSGVFAEKPINKPESFRLDEDDFVIVAADAAVGDALRRFKQMGIESTQFIICANQFVDDDDLTSFRIK